MGCKLGVRSFMFFNYQENNLLIDGLQYASMLRNLEEREEGEGEGRLQVTVNWISCTLMDAFEMFLKCPNGLLGVFLLLFVSLMV